MLALLGKSRVSTCLYVEVFGDERFSFFSDLAIQSTILNSSWFKASKRLCAYISCYRLREVDTSKILAEVLSLNPGKSIYRHAN
jgi:hypothetical protein